MSSKRYRIIFILIFMLMSGAFCETTKQHMTNDMENAQSDVNKDGRALFPRIEYNNEWQPVGRGDPLKDPTYDYMPPVLDRVRYWGEGTSKGNKNDVLVLGVPSKKHSSIKQKEKFNYGPIKRTYYSPPYQHHFSPPLHHQQQQQQQQQHLPQRLMPPPKFAVDSYPMSTQHHQHFQPHGWKTPNNAYNEPRPENSINQMMHTRPTLSPTTTRNPSSVPFLPTVSPVALSQEPTSTSPTLWMSSHATTVKHKEHMMPSQPETAKPLLHSILQTETAAPFTKMPSSAYQIEYTSNIYSPEAINSMAMSSSYASTFTPTKASIRPIAMKTTAKTSPVPSFPTSTSSNAIPQEKKQYVQPEMNAAWPVYNLIIEGHSKVKTYGLKNEDEIENHLPKIRPVQPKQNPVVERVTSTEKGPTFEVKHLKPNKHPKKPALSSSSSEENAPSPMSSFFSLLESSFGNFLADENQDKVRPESETKNAKNERENSEKRKTRRSIPDESDAGDGDDQRERVFSVSFNVGDTAASERPDGNYRKGIVISETLWPFQTADASS